MFLSPLFKVLIFNLHRNVTENLNIQKSIIVQIHGILYRFSPSYTHKRLLAITQRDISNRKSFFYTFPISLRKSRAAHRFIDRKQESLLHRPRQLHAFLIHKKISSGLFLPIYFSHFSNQKNHLKKNASAFRFKRKDVSKQTQGRLDSNARTFYLKRTCVFYPSFRTS